MRGLTLCLANIWRVAGRCASRPQHQRRVCAICIHARCGNQDLAQAPAQRPESIHHDDGFVCRFDECGQDAKCCPAENKTAPKPSQSEKPEAAIERSKPLWLCCLGGGRWRTRTSEPRACEADPALDCRGLHGTFLRNRGPVGTLGDSLALTTVPKPSQEFTPDKLPIGFTPVTWGELIRRLQAAGFVEQRIADLLSDES
jgi:hypothetical protein